MLIDNRVTIRPRYGCAVALRMNLQALPIL